MLFTFFLMQDPYVFLYNFTKHIVALYLWRPTTAFSTLRTLQRIAEKRRRRKAQRIQQIEVHSYNSSFFQTESQLPTFHCKPRPQLYPVTVHTQAPPSIQNVRTLLIGFIYYVIAITILILKGTKHFIIVFTTRQLIIQNIIKD